MTVYFDIDTQIDFMFPTGALYVPGAEDLVDTIGKLNQYGVENGKVVSTMCAHSENDPEFQEWPPHCVLGTTGQQKPAKTLIGKHVLVPPDAAVVNVADAKHVILQKRKLDLFTNPNIDSLLKALNADTYVVYGVVTEYCVQHAAFGLLNTGKPVQLVTDAIRSLNEAKSKEVIDRFQAQGGELTTVKELLAG